MEGSTQMSAQPAHLESTPHIPHYPQSCAHFWEEGLCKHHYHVCLNGSEFGANPGARKSSSCGSLLQPRQYLPIPPAPQAKSSVDRNKAEPLRKKKKSQILVTPSGLPTQMRARKWAESPQKQHILELFAKDHCLVKA